MSVCFALKYILSPNTKEKSIAKPNRKAKLVVGLNYDL